MYKLESLRIYVTQEIKLIPPLRCLNCKEVIAKLIVARKNEILAE